MSDKDRLSTPYRDVAPTTARFPISPSVGGAASNIEQVTIRRDQDPGNGFSVVVVNLSKKTAFTFSIQQSDDAGQNDAYVSMNLRLGTATVTSVLLQPGGMAEVDVDYSASQKKYIALFTDSANAWGWADFIYNNGTLDRTRTPILTTALDNGYAGALDSGVVALLSATYTPVLVWTSSINVNTPRSVRLTGVVAVQALSHLQLEIQSTVGGAWEVVGSDANFNTASDVVPQATTNAYQTAAGSAFVLTVNMAGAVGFRISAKSAVDAGTLRLTGMSGA